MTPDHAAKDSHDNEEPAITQEESVPLDGTDVEGEEMMKSVRNDLLMAGSAAAAMAGVLAGNF